MVTSSRTLLILTWPILSILRSRLLRQNSNNHSPRLYLSSYHTILSHLKLLSNASQIKGKALIIIMNFPVNWLVLVSVLLHLFPLKFKQPAYFGYASPSSSMICPLLVYNPHTFQSLMGTCSCIFPHWTMHLFLHYLQFKGKKWNMKS